MKKRVIVLIFCVVALLIVGIVAFFIFFNKQKNFDYNNENIVFAVDVPADFDQFKMGRLEEKKRQALDLYRKDKNDTRTWIVIGNFHEYAHNYERAIVDYEKTLSIEPLEMISITNIAHIYDDNLNDYAKAEEYYKRALENTSASYQTYIDLALMYEYKMRKPTLAAATYLDGLRYYYDNPVLLIQLIRFYRRQNDLAEASKYADILLKANSENKQLRDEFDVLIKK